jgi:hypothetical protein
MTRQDLEKIVLYIIVESVKLKNKYTNEISAKVEFCDIFCRDNREYEQLTEIINKIGKVVYTTPTGNIYLLKKPVKTIAGKLYLVKIRKPDKKLRFRGDADFDTDYPELKQIYQNRPNFELIVRDKFEMLRLSHSDFDVMVCFSNIPVREWI